MIVSKCGCTFASNKEVADKIREKSVENAPMPQPALIECECGETITMSTLLYKCPYCKMTYAVTPCSADDHNYIVKVGIDY